MMRLKFTISYSDGRSVTATSRPATEVAFERKFERTVGSLFVDLDIPEGAGDRERSQMVRSFVTSIRADYLYFLAWHSARSETPYDDWLELVESINWDIADTADPTRPAVPAGS